MGAERREHERFVFPGSVELNHNNYNLQCSVENISNYGAFLKIENQKNTHPIEIGDIVSFKAILSDKQPFELSGHILRAGIEMGHCYIAVYFIKPYEFN
jgi:hypothetical protein